MTTASYMFGHMAPGRMRAGFGEHLRRRYPNLSEEKIAAAVSAITFHPASIMGDIGLAREFGLYMASLRGEGT